MEAIHVGAAIKSGASLVHGVQMMNKVNKFVLRMLKLIKTKK